MAFELPDLPYAHDALEPHIDARTMEIHHGKHHATYIGKSLFQGVTNLDSREVMIKIGAKHADQRALGLLLKEATGLALTAPPGLTLAPGARTRRSASTPAA